MLPAGLGMLPVGASSNASVRRNKCSPPKARLPRIQLLVTVLDANHSGEQEFDAGYGNLFPWIFLFSPT